MNHNPDTPSSTNELRNAVPADAESLAPPPSSNLDADITDELTDHLSLAARDLQLAGHAADEAQKSLNKNLAASPPFAAACGGFRKEI